MPNDTPRPPIAVICAIPDELVHLREALPPGQEEWRGNRCVWHTELDGEPVLLALCGIGMMAAAAVAESVICRYQPAAVLNFGCTGAHYHFNWGSDEFRKGILNCIVWIAHVDVPADGVKSKTPTPDELLANLDGGNGKRKPANLTNESLQQQIDRMNSQRTAGK